MNVKIVQQDRKFWTSYRRTWLIKRPPLGKWEGLLNRRVSPIKEATHGLARGLVETQIYSYIYEAWRLVITVTHKRPITVLSRHLLRVYMLSFFNSYDPLLRLSWGLKEKFKIRLFYLENSLHGVLGGCCQSERMKWLTTQEVAPDPSSRSLDVKIPRVAALCDMTRA